MQTWWKDLIRGLCLVAFFVSTLFLSSFSERVFLSPDENANFYFAQTLGETGRLSAPVLPDEATRGNLSTVLLHPRSIVTVGEQLLPGSFLGLPILAGGAYKLAGDTGALLLTPLLALLAVLAFRATINKLFEDEALADLSALFLMIHPSFLYFSGRVMMHNVAFLAFIIFAIYFAAARPLGLKSRFVREFRRLEFFLSGAMVGTALLVRASEAPWVIPVFVFLLLVYRNELGWRNIVSSIIGFGALCAVILATNSWVYGGLFATGYTVQVAAPVLTEISNPESIASTSTTSPLYNFSPYGFHPRAILRNFWSYGIVLYPWMTVPALLGALLLVVRKFEKKKVWKVLFVVSIFVGCWLVAYYGSARINDNPDPSVLTIGNSYVRYWLPIFALAAPFTAYLMVSAWRYVSAEGFATAKPLQRRAWQGMLVILVLAAAVKSTDLVLNGHDGIITSRAALSSFISKRYNVLSKTELNSIIIVDRADKYLFPRRAVVTPLRNENTYDALPTFVEHAPTYYFGITFPQQDLDFLNNDKLKADQLKIEHVVTLNEESLYRFSKTK